GVTCVAEVMDLGPGWQAMQEFDLQGVAYQEVFGPAESQSVEALAGLQQKIDTYRPNETETRRIGVSPHAPYTVSSKLFGAVNEYSVSVTLPMTTHMADSKAEGLLVRHATGPFAEGLRERG